MYRILFSGENVLDCFLNFKLTLTYQNLFFIKYMPTFMRHIFLFKYIHILTAVLQQELKCV